MARILPETAGVGNICPVDRHSRPKDSQWIRTAIHRRAGNRKSDPGGGSLISHSLRHRSVGRGDKDPIGGHDVIVEVVAGGPGDVLRSRHSVFAVAHQSEALPIG